MSNKKRISWITPDYFYCADACIVPELAEEFSIDWFLINTNDAQRKSQTKDYPLVKQHEINLKYRQRDPRIIWQYFKILFEIRKAKPDIIYLSFHGLPFFFPIFFLLIDRRKVIYAVHNVSIPKGASNEKFMRLYQDYAFSRIRNFHVFSKFQLDVIKRMLPYKNHYYAPFVLEEYGPSNVAPTNDCIRFLAFGYIRKYKRLDLLIDAFQNLHDSGVRNIELLIAGNCENWDEYQSMIRISDKINAIVKVIPNKDIPDIVSSCHYMVLPYQDSAQSAVLTLAYQYNKPVIVSNIEAFKQFVIEGKTGYFFESESVSALQERMRDVVNKHETDYSLLTSNIPSFVEKEFSLDVIREKYKAFLNECIA